MVVLVVIGIFGGMWVIKSSDYNKALAQLEAGNYQQAQDEFEALGGFRDARAQAAAAGDWVAYRAAQQLFEAGDYKAAQAAFEALGSFEDSRDLAGTCGAIVEITAGLTGELNGLKDPSSNFWKVDAANMFAAFEDTGVDRESLIEAWMTDFEAGGS